MKLSLFLLCLLPTIALSRDIVVNGKLFVVSDTNSRVIIDVPMPEAKVIRVEVPVHDDTSYQDYLDDLDDEKAECSTVSPVSTVNPDYSVKPTYEAIEDDSQLGDWNDPTLDGGV